MNSNYLDEIADHGASLVTRAALTENGSVVTDFEPISWQSASDGQIAMDGDIEFSVSGGTTVNGVRLTASDESTIYGDESVTEESYSSNGTYVLTNITIDHSSV